MPKGVFSLPVIVTLCPQWIFYVTQKPDQTSAVRRSLPVFAFIWEVIFNLSPAILVSSRNTSSKQEAIRWGGMLHDETKTAVKETRKF